MGNKPFVEVQCYAGFAECTVSRLLGKPVVFYRLYDVTNKKYIDMKQLSENKFILFSEFKFKRSYQLQAWYSTNTKSEWSDVFEVDIPLHDPNTCHLINGYTLEPSVVEKLKGISKQMTVIVLGQQGVGKSAFLNTLAKATGNSDVYFTEGFNYNTNVIQISESNNISTETNMKTLVLEGCKKMNVINTFGVFNSDSNFKWQKGPKFFKALLLGNIDFEKHYSNEDVESFGNSMLKTANPELRCSVAIISIDIQQLLGSSASAYLDQIGNLVNLCNECNVRQMFVLTRVDHDFSTSLQFKGDIIRVNNDGSLTVIQERSVSLSQYLFELTAFRDCSNLIRSKFKNSVVFPFISVSQDNESTINDNPKARDVIFSLSHLVLKQIISMGTDGITQQQDRYAKKE